MDQLIQSLSNNNKTFTKQSYDSRLSIIGFTQYVAPIISGELYTRGREWIESLRTVKFYQERGEVMFQVILIIFPINRKNRASQSSEKIEEDFHGTLLGTWSNSMVMENNTIKTKFFFFQNFKKDS